MLCDHDADIVAKTERSNLISSYFRSVTKLIFEFLTEFVQLKHSSTYHATEIFSYPTSKLHLITEKNQLFLQVCKGVTDFFSYFFKYVNRN